MSRGAKSCVFCDSNIKAIKTINQNLLKTHLLEKSLLLNMDYKKCLQKLYDDSFKFDIVFIDPPYKSDIAVKAIKQLIELRILNFDSLIILETDEIIRDEMEIDILLNSNEKK